VYKTTGYAVNLTGANDSEVTASNTYSFGNDTSWTVSAWLQPNSTASSTTMTGVSVSEGELVVYYNGSESRWYAWYYRQDTRNSYEVSVAASGDETGNLTNIQAVANGTDLTIYRFTEGGSAQQGTVADITVANTEAAPTEADNWHGTIEEVRAFADPLDATNRSELRTAPVEQQPDLDRRMRVMFDKPHDQDAIVLFQNSDATISNGSVAKVGFSEQVMDPKTATNDASGDTDYEFKRDGPSVRVASAPLGTSELQGAPVVFVTYDSVAAGVVLLVGAAVGVVADAT